MRKSATFFVAAVIVAGILGFAPARAVPPCDVDSGSEATPQLIDATADYDAFVGGNQVGLPTGDIYGDSNDLLSGWLARSESGAYTANLRIGKFDGIETNAIYYVKWSFGGVDRFVSAEITLPGPMPRYDFQYGHLDNSGPVPSLVRDGATTGTMETGVPGKITIAVPMLKMGKPTSGDVLTAFSAESRFLIGTPQTGGLVTVEDLTDADPCSDIDIP